LSVCQIGCIRNRGHALSIVRAHDAFDRLQAVTDRYCVSLTYTCDPAGSRTSLQDSDGNFTRYTCDALQSAAG
jgi:YD repeat-containing protein